jgi:hypothetical protein
MFTKIFATGNGKIKHSINYLLSDFDHTGKKREPKPVVLDGNPALVEAVGNTISRKRTYTAGSINFRENEVPTLDQRESIMKSFEKTFLAGLEKGEDFTILWVEHWDKGRLELNFVIPDKELKSGRSLNVTRPGEINQQFFRDFDSYNNQKLGFEQVKRNPFRVQLNKLDTISGHSFNVKNQKNKISDILSEKIMSGEIRNRDELIELFGGKDKFSRIGKDYLSLKTNNGETKSIRLKGPIFEENADYQKLIDEFKSKPNKLEVDEYREVATRLMKQINYRKSQNKKMLSLPVSKIRKSNNPSGKKKVNPIETKSENLAHPTNIRTNEIHKELPKSEVIKTEKPKSIDEVLTKDVQKSSVDEKYKKLSVSKNILDIRNILKEKPSENTTKAGLNTQKLSTSSNDKVPLALDIMNLESEVLSLQSKLSTASMKDRITIINQINKIQYQLQELRRKQSEIIKNKKPLV